MLPKLSKLTQQQWTTKSNLIEPRLPKRQRYLTQQNDAASEISRLKKLKEFLCNDDSLTAAYPGPYFGGCDTQAFTAPTAQITNNFSNNPEGVPQGALPQITSTSEIQSNNGRHPVPLLRCKLNKENFGNHYSSCGPDMGLLLQAARYPKKHPNLHHMLHHNQSSSGNPNNILVGNNTGCATSKFETSSSTNLPERINKKVYSISKKRLRLKQIVEYAQPEPQGRLGAQRSHSNIKISQKIRIFKML